MKDAVMVARPDGLTQVYRMHGGFGLIEWKRMAVGEMLFGDWQSVDYNRIKPGAGSADHIQSRTEEIWFLVSGKAEIHFDGDQVREMHPGDLLFTPQYGQHRIKNIGDEDLEVLVVEVFPRSVIEALPAHKPTEAED
jgi:mannose-6-phosphate isomerase-like protein (cupin superfamily)